MQQRNPPERWLWAAYALAGALVVLLGACGREKPVSQGPDGGAGILPAVWQVFPNTVNRDIDILFMIDNSGSMTSLQENLVRNFPSFINVLKGLPGGLPNLHIAVVSSDMGAGRFGTADLPTCPHGGDAAIFRSAPQGDCLTSGLNPGQHFIVNVNGQANYDATKEIADVFGCIARLGEAGCGFEHQFASVIRALGADGQPPPPENNGFLRPNATLAIVLLTNEDDCSAPPDSALFDPASRMISDPLGPLASYRCNEFGHLCNGQKPPRTMAADLTGQCHSAEDGTLFKVADVVQQIKALKADPNKILAIAIAGPTAPYVINEVPSLGGGGVMEDQPQIGHSCVSNLGFADPSIRIKEWVDGFGHNGLFLPICDDTLTPALQPIANQVGAKAVAEPCIQGRLADADFNAPGLQPDCRAKNRYTDLQGHVVEIDLPACASNGATPPCWRLKGSNASPTCVGGTTLDISLGPASLPDDLEVWVSCTLCDPSAAPTPSCNY